MFGMPYATLTLEENALENVSDKQLYHRLDLYRVSIFFSTVLEFLDRKGMERNEVIDAVAVSIVRMAVGTLARTYFGTPSAAGPTNTATEPRVVSITTTEQGRSEERLGVERRKIDNSRSATSSVRRLRAQRTWSRKSEIFFERATKGSSSAGLNIQGVGSLKAAAEKSFRESLALSGEEQQTFEEGIEVTIPARTAVEVLLHWKTIWQEGVLAIEMDDGETYKIPYRVTVGMTFDQENRDL